jgi:toxin CptA
MHNAPSVSYPVGRPLSAGLLGAVLWSAGVAVTLFWAHQADQPGWRQAAAGLMLAVFGGWTLLAWLRSPRGDLHWDGSGWTTPLCNAAGAIEVTLDLQRLLLVRWSGPGSSQWLWLERRRYPQRWMDLRRAVYSRARPQALPPARPPAATP